MATPASNAAVLSNNCFLMEWLLLFGSHPVRTQCAKVHGKTNFDRVQFRQRAAFPATPRRSVPVDFRGTESARGRRNRAMFGCNAKMPSQRTSVLAGMSFVPA
jgi:hypothetical protein